MLNFEKKPGAIGCGDYVQEVAMSTIDSQIQWYEARTERKENGIIKAKLKMIKSLCDEISASEDRIFVDEIVEAFAEILKVQQGMISALEIEKGRDTLVRGEVRSAGQDEVDEALIVAEIPDFCEEERASHPYFPPVGGFQSDAQVRRAFVNFLTYHSVKEMRDGKKKNFSKYTVYDYSSRISVLFEIFYNEWCAGGLEGKLAVSIADFLPGSTFLNAYRHIELLEKYLAEKSLEVKMRSNEQIAARVADGMRGNPLDNPRNLANTLAALAKFREFKARIMKSE